jgi:extradiol dioxygenase family protein
MLRPFHLAIPVDDLAKAAEFYGNILGCKQGRSDSHWIDWDFFGHQLVTHLTDAMPPLLLPNEVDNKSVPIPHFGIILSEPDWHGVANALKSHNIEFQIAPYIRFEGQAGEQGTFFVFDYAKNALEFKYFQDLNQVFTP